MVHIHLFLIIPPENSFYCPKLSQIFTICVIRTIICVTICVIHRWRKLWKFVKAWDYKNCFPVELLKINEYIYIYIYVNLIVWMFLVSDPAVRGIRLGVVSFVCVLSAQVQPTWSAFFSFTASCFLLSTQPNLAPHLGRVS